MLGAASCRRADPLPQLPHVMLWAWERPEHLPFLDPHTAGVAFLARTVSWRYGRIESRARYQPLEVPPATVMVAVVRLESFTPPLPDAAAVAAEIVPAAGFP